MEKVHYKINVKGIVQGVWFRKYTKDEAERLGLKGFVKNEINGNVYTEVEGPKMDVNDFIKWIHKGSPRSKVEKVSYEKGDFIGFESFKITR